MPATIGQMTKKEFTEMLSSLIEKKLREVLADPEESYELQPKVETRLKRKIKSVAKGERGIDFEKAVIELLLE